jgi:uncharacterized protein
VGIDALGDALPASWDAMPAPMIDGFLCGLLLQPRRPPVDRWWPLVLGRPAADASTPPAAQELRTRVQQRAAELERAIEQRRWFDPWIYAPDDQDDLRAALLPWVAGFAEAMASFEDLGDAPNPALDEPLALLYRHLDPDDLEDADDLLALIEALPPPADLGEAVEDLVRATLLIADETRPRG